ncbi:MAG TPA: hypothetical protein VLA15_02890 [Desulfurivibrionaceae bacterium]|nr:hypothetical protein [Desulfurivibrionaceae bacterium]
MSQAKGRQLSGRILTLTLICAAILWIPAGRAEAALAMGPYLDLSSGDGSFEWDSDNFDFDVDSSSAAIGFALDSAPTGPANFNYRLNIGLERQDLEDEFDDTLEMGGFVVESVFGFALVHQQDFRWWAGPLVRIGFYSGETDDYYDSNGYRSRTEADLFELGLGVATGINVRIGPHIYLAPSAGIRFIGAASEGTVKNLDLHTEYEDDLSGAQPISS